MSILGIYNQNLFSEGWRVGTPDPNRYHDVSAVHLETSGGVPMANRMPGGHGYSGLRGVIIPRASIAGAVSGFDHMLAQKAYIDPELTNKQILFDPAKMMADPNKVANSIRSAYSKGFANASDAIVSAYEPFTERPANDTLVTPVQVARPNQQQQYPQQPQPQQAAVVPMPNMPPLAQTQPTVMRQEKVASFFEAIKPVPGQQAGNEIPLDIRSLRSELETTPAQKPKRGMRKVTFEIPLDGGAGSLGQFPCLYHAVLRNEDILTLVYDHSQPAQMVYFPPVFNDRQSGQTVAIAVMVEADGEEPAMLYLAYPTGAKFRYRDEEFCHLTIEREKIMSGKNAE